MGPGGIPASEDQDPTGPRPGPTWRRQRCAEVERRWRCRGGRRRQRVPIAATTRPPRRPDRPGPPRAGLAGTTLPTDDLVGHAQLAQRLDTPICLDESVTSLGVVETALALGLRPIMCVKAARLGGPTPARRLLDWCHDEGLDAYIGGMLSSGIGRAADRALAGLAAANRVGDIGGDDRYFTEDVTSTGCHRSGGAGADGRCRGCRRARG
ncbi:MAG: hypothetical protein IPN02_18790 [Candidatus Microthrix sp.]|uniref:Enolase C-terminal domain-containing protein n=1 Tax=Candidatus Neomicrothrix subdominans TaxID=2954438 RepID=A0A936NEG0_9ACTN|nr:hypothetical protein [Candidatus Microthrix subdominans]